MQWVQVGQPAVQKQRGKWVVRQGGYDPMTGRRRVRQLGMFETKRAAVGHQRAVLDGPAGTEGETVAEFLEHLWLPAKDRLVESSTYDQSCWAVDRHIVPLIGKVRLRDLSPEVVDGCVSELIQPVVDGGKPRLGPTSAPLVRKVLSRAMEEAVQRGRLARNPVVLTQPPRLDDRTSVSAGRSKRRSSSARRRGSPPRCAFHLWVVTGLRRGELLALRWTDIDLRARELTVHQQIAIEQTSRCSSS